MKKYLVLIALLTLLVSSSSAQKINFGPKIGYSASKLSTNLDNITESARHNFMAGLFFRFGDKLYFQPEVMYHARGGTLDSAGLEQTLKFKNIEIPLMIGFKLLNLKVINLRFMGGPVASYILDKDITFNALVNDPIQVSDIDDLLWGLDVGLGLDVLFLTLDIRYEFGLNNIYSGTRSIDMKNNLWTVGLGFKLF